MSNPNLESFLQSTDPTEHIHDREFIEAVLRVGSYVTMVEEKRINVAALFTLLFENDHYKDVFMELTGMDSFQEAILYLLCLHPSLLKSKNTKTLIRRLDAKRKREHLV